MKDLRFDLRFDLKDLGFEEKWGFEICDLAKRFFILFWKDRFECKYKLESK